MAALEESYRYCVEVARRRAKNFYYSFLLLSRQQRLAMCAVYAFMRYCDDLSDEPGATREPILAWRSALEEALRGQCDRHPSLPAFSDTVQTFQIPHEYFFAMIDGVLSDMEPREVRTFTDLYRYCYQVSGVVGLTTVHIFGFDSPEALPLAEKCGIAFQLTNILRDVREDAERGRVYLPTEDLERFAVPRQQILDLRESPQLVGLLQYEATRARDYYRQSMPLIGLVHRRSRPSLRALIGIYSSLLGRIEESNFDVIKRRIALSGREKSWIALKAAVAGS